MLRAFQKTLLTVLFALFASQASAIFIQPDWFDPTLPGVGTNRYAYSFNDPINRLDPSGNASQVSPEDLDERGEYTVDDETGDVTLIDKHGYRVDVLGGSLSKDALAKLSKCQPACDLDAILRRHAMGVNTMVDQLAGGFRKGPETYDYRPDPSAGLDALMAIPGAAAAGATIKLVKVARGARRICSFHADTLVLTEDGLLPIHSIFPGMKVWSRNAETGEMGWKNVLEAYSNSYSDRVEINIVDIESGQTHKILSNRIHPFFAQVGRFDGNASARSVPYSTEGYEYGGPIANGFWVDASSLRAGYRLLNSDQSWSEVESVRILPEGMTAFNLMVEDYHTYFVSASSGSKSVWVHNNCFDFERFTVIHKGMNLRKFDGVSTKDIIDSLFKGPEPLLVSRDGRIFKGNARIQELMNRGYDMGRIRNRLSGANFHETRNPFIPPGLE